MQRYAQDYIASTEIGFHSACCRFAFWNIEYMSGLKAFLPSFFLFLLLNGLFVLFQRMLTGYGFSTQVLLWGNVFLFGLSIISFLLQQKAAKSTSPQLIVRYFYISFLVKLILVAVVALIYAKAATKVNKASVIACMVFYMLYTFIEISMLLKAGKQKNA
jgi:hypothetical protein